MLYEVALREAVAVFDRIHREIDPIPEVNANPVAFESEIECADIPPTLQQRIDGVILAGTELPLLLRSSSIEGVELLDTTRVHVDAIIDTLLDRSAD